MTIDYSAFILPHIGDNFSQCADRFSYSEASKSFAIADGVGNSLFPGKWAAILCDEYVMQPNNFINVDKSGLIQEDDLIFKWEEYHKERIANLSENERFIYEMGLDKADFAASTFVGLVVDTKGWHCQAIGDSYLFVIDEKYDVIAKVASMDGRDFDNFPEYFASKKGLNNGKIKERTGTFENVAYLALMTDAISDWFIKATAYNRERLLNIKKHQDYEDLVNSERQNQALKDDDTTIVVLKIIHDDSEGVSFITSSEQVDKIDSFISIEDNFEHEQVKTIERDLSTNKTDELDNEQGSLSVSNVENSVEISGECAMIEDNSQFNNKENTIETNERNTIVEQDFLSVKNLENTTDSIMENEKERVSPATDIKMSSNEINEEKIKEKISKIASDFQYKKNPLILQKYIRELLEIIKKYLANGTTH